MNASEIPTPQLDKRERGDKDTAVVLSKIIDERHSGTYNRYQFKFIMVANALLNGKPFAEILRDKKGIPVELVHLPNSVVVLKINQETGYRLLYFFNDGKKQ